MSRVNVFLFLGLAFSSICFGATLMQISVTRNNPEKNNGQSTPVNSSCRTLISKFRHEGQERIAQKIYELAYTKSFNGDNDAAETANCARTLINDGNAWNLDSHDLIK